MRSIPLRPPLWLLCLVFCVVGAQAQNPPTSLEAQVHAIAAEHHGDIALFAENLKTHETVAISPDMPVQTASVIKLAILYEALKQVRSGKAHFDDKITLTASDQVAGSGVLLFFDAPLSLTLKDVLTMMIVMSDNSATNLVIDHLGLENIDAQIAKLGLKDTYLYKKVFMPAPAGKVMPADQKKFGLGKTTAREMAFVMTKIARCELAEPGSPTQADDAKLCQVALKMLHVQFYRSAIPRYLDGMQRGDERLDCEQDRIARCSAERCCGDFHEERYGDYFGLHVQQQRPLVGGGTRGRVEYCKVGARDYSELVAGGFGGLA
jgi:beta-lactamase class A